MSCQISSAWRITIMNQPLPITDEVGVCRGNGEIVHPLRLGDDGHGLYRARGPGRFPNMLPHLQFSRVQPGVGGRVEGMFGRGHNRLAINRQVHHLDANVRDQVSHRILADFPGRFMVRQHQVARLNLLNGDGAISRHQHCPHLGTVISAVLYQSYDVPR